MRRCSVVLALIAILAVVVALPASADTILSDSTYSNLAIVQNTFPTSPATVTINSAGVCANCGQSGVPAIQIVISYTDLGVASAAVLVVDNSLTYNPATQGSITSLTASVSHNFALSGAFSPLGSGVIGPFTTGFSPLIYQGGTYYVDSTIPGPNLSTAVPGGASTGYSLLSQSGLTAANFVAFNPVTDSFMPGSNPNFSSGPITFGLAELQSFNIDSAEVNVTTTSDFDPLSFSIASAPEPSSLLLLAVGLSGLLCFALLRRHREA